MRKENLRILVVDDSAVVRSFLKGILQSDENITVIDTAANGQVAVEKANLLKPDLITMDINMPVLNGFEASEQIMQTAPTPIVIVSGNYTSADVSMTFEALKTGAVSILPKPDGLGSANFLESRKKFLDMIWLMSEIKVVRKYTSQTKIQSSIPANSFKTPSKTNLLAIGTSAGGPLVLQKLFKQLPSSFPYPIVIVQHVDPSFAEGFASWLRETTNKNVRIATNGEKISPNTIYLAPGDRHIGLKDKDTLIISASEPINGCRPSVSYLFDSICATDPKNTVNIILSGMGKDGALELKKLKDAGAITIVQNKSSALVFGMPGEALKIGGASMDLSTDEISEYINKLS